MSDVASLIDQYYSWLKDKTAWQSVGKYVEITAPYLDRNNDYIQIYLQKTDNGFLLTDDGSTIRNLQQDGCSLNSPKRQKLLNSTLVGYGVVKENDILQITATVDNFPIKKHSLIQSILAVNDMFYLAESHVANLFFEDVRGWLDVSQISYSENILFIGKSGYERKFDFLITKSDGYPERIIKTVNNPKRNNVDSIVMDWLDTKGARPKDSKAYAFINDNDRDIASSALEALNSYEIKPILWNNREQSRNELAA